MLVIRIDQPARNTLVVNKGNMSERSSIRSVDRDRVINKIRGRRICLMTKMITDRIGRHEVRLLSNSNYDKKY